MNVRYYRRKLFATALVCASLVACAYAAYDSGQPAALFQRAWNGMLGRSPEQSSDAPTLVAGDALRVTPGNTVIENVTSEQLEQRIAWATGHGKDQWLEFKGETLGQVVAEFNRHNGTQITIDGPATSDLHIGGKFLATDVDGFVAALEETHSVQAVKSRKPGRAEVIVLTRKAR